MKSLFTVLVSPTETFERLRERKKAWISAFIALIAVSLANVWLQMPLLEKSTRAAVEKVQGMDADAAVKAAQIFGYAFAPVSVAALVFLGAVLLLFVNMFVRGEAKYGQLISVFLYAYVPVMIEGLLMGVLSRATDANDVQDITLSAGALFPDKEGFLFQLGKVVNPFSIWAVALAVIGTAVMARRSRGAVAVWIVGGWLAFRVVFALINSAMTAVSA